ncbi:hypothetical protein [Sphingomonas sp.]|jgi:hypothetical protein|uniref:hypothetical protein n=1 Tax=Sphingomonas sp. TaxID=28214 RepID=UPI0035618C06
MKAIVPPRLVIPNKAEAIELNSIEQLRRAKRFLRLNSAREYLEATHQYCNTVTGEKREMTGRFAKKLNDALDARFIYEVSTKVKGARLHKWKWLPPQEVIQVYEEKIKARKERRHKRSVELTAFSPDNRRAPTKLFK